MLSSRTTLGLARARALPLLRASSPTLHRHQYHASVAMRLPYKDDQDRESLKPRSSEGTKSTTDEDVAAHDDAAFNPKKTGPGTEKETAGKGVEGNPLEASGANQKLSKPQGDKPGGEGAEPADNKRKSGGSTGKKHGKVQN